MDTERESLHRQWMSDVDVWTNGGSRSLRNTPSWYGVSAVGEAVHVQTRICGEAVPPSHFAVHPGLLRWVKEPAAKPGDPSLIPRTHMVEEESRLMNVVLCHGICAYEYTQSHTYTK